jgi:DNA invertase Pin-like site-specific DNA recombinase
VRDRVSSPRGRSASAEPPALRCAIYTRKSTTMGLEQEFNSLDAQREASTAYIARQQGWSITPERYDDGGFTGANIDRPAFTRLMEDAEAGKFDVVVVYKVDRLSRSLLDFVKVMERLNAAGVSFVSVTQNFTTADAMGRLTMNMLMSFAEFEREMIAERTRDKIAMSRRKGKWTGGQVPFGYVAKDKRLVPHELESLIVRDAFDLMVKYRQTCEVARALNEQQKLPRGARLRAGRLLAWTTSGIANLLKSPLYAGVIAHGGERYRGEHPALIDEDTFERVQRILEGRDKTPLTFHGTNHDYLLKGLLRCGLCGAAMSPGSTRRARKVYRYYRCSTHDKHGPKGCPALRLPAGAIEDYVVERIAEAAFDGGLAREVEAALTERLDQRRKDLAELRTKLPGPIANYAANASRYVEELTRVEGKARELVEQRLHIETQRLAAAERQLRDAERALTDLESTAAEVRHVIGALGDFRLVWEAMTTLNRGRLLRALLDHVAVEEASGRVDIHLVDFTADPDAPSGAPEAHVPHVPGRDAA